jgi:hypothetical protein
MNLLIGDNTLQSAMLMRVFNSFLAILLLTITAIYATPFIRFALLGTWVSVVTPLAYLQFLPQIQVVGQLLVLEFIGQHFFRFCNLKKRNIY